jgi:hypothetical protein
MMVRPPEGGKPVKAVGVERRDPGVRQMIIETDGMMVNTMKTKKKKVTRVVADPIRAWRPSIVRMDSLKGPEVAVTIPATNQVMEQQALEGWMGAVSGGLVIRARRIDSSILQKVADTVAALNIFRNEDFVTLYPNPVERGGALHLAWLLETGSYQLALLDMRGRLMAERLVGVGGAGQVDQWVMPVGLAAGVYALRIVRVGNSRVDVREVVVR